MTKFMQVTMSNHKSTESTLKNIEVQEGQLPKQIADKSSNNFVALDGFKLLFVVALQLLKLWNMWANVVAIAVRI